MPEIASKEVVLQAKYDQTMRALKTTLQAYHDLANICQPDRHMISSFTLCGEESCREAVKMIDKIEKIGKEV